MKNSNFREYCKSIACYKLINNREFHQVSRHKIEKQAFKSQVRFWNRITNMKNAARVSRLSRE